MKDIIFEKAFPTVSDPDVAKVQEITMAMAGAAAEKGADVRQMLAALAIMVGTLIKHYYAKEKHDPMILAHTSNVQAAAKE